LQSMDTEWEVAVLYGLSQLGQVFHEPGGTGARKLDVHFKSADIEYWGDIVAITDGGVNKANPVDAFQKELVRRIRKSGLSGAGFSLTIGTRLEKLETRTKRVLALPKPSGFKQFFDQEVRAFIAGIKAKPDQLHSAKVATPGIELEFAYAPKGASM